MSAKLVPEMDPLVIRSKILRRFRLERTHSAFASEEAQTILSKLRDDLIADLFVPQAPNKLVANNKTPLLRKASILEPQQVTRALSTERQIRPKRLQRFASMHDPGIVQVLGDSASVNVDTPSKVSAHMERRQKALEAANKALQQEPVAESCRSDLAVKGLPPQRFASMHDPDMVTRVLGDSASANVDTPSKVSTHLERRQTAMEAANKALQQEPAAGSCRSDLAVKGLPPQRFASMHDPDMVTRVLGDSGSANVGTPSKVSTHLEKRQKAMEAANKVLQQEPAAGSCRSIGLAPPPLQAKRTASSCEPKRVKQVLRDNLLAPRRFASMHDPEAVTQVLGNSVSASASNVSPQTKRRMKVMEAANKALQQETDVGLLPNS